MADTPAEPSKAVDLDDLAGWLDADRQLTAQMNALEAQAQPFLDQAKELADARDTIRRRFQERMGDAHEARIGGRPVIKWKPHKPATYIDREALERDHPKIAEAYTREKKPVRKFIVLDPPAAGQ